MSTVRVLLFSVLREKLGCTSMDVTIGQGTTSGMLVDELTSTHPVLADYRGSLRIAVNQEYVDLDHPVREGDEVALITPVSGG